MDGVHFVIHAILGVVAGSLHLLNRHQAGKFAKHETRIITMERDILKCHEERDADRTNHRQLSQFFEDKMVRTERERDIALANHSESQQRVIDLQERIEELRRGRK